MRVKNNAAKNSRLPYLVIFGGFLAFIVSGTLLLTLPISQKNQGASFFESAFTAVSAVCVTGLSVIDNLSGTYTVFGQIVIALLIQIGGLGFVTTAMFVFTLIGAKISWSKRELIKETLNQNASRGMVILVKRVVFITFCIEFIGFLINLFVFIKMFSFTKALGYSAFHAISSFNNAGFTLWLSGSVVIENNFMLAFSTCALIICGGLGFIVISEIITLKNIKRMSFHAKIVLIFTLNLIVIGSVIIKISQPSLTVSESVFLSISSRTAGFSSANTLALTPAAITFLIGLMLIGASPSSTGGGLKTTTFAVIISSVKAFISGKPPSLFYRRFTKETLLKAYVLTLFSLFFIFLCVFLLTLTENKYLQTNSISGFALVFEAVSAFCTCGLSLGITPFLSAAGKVILCVLMFVGRLGPLTLISVLSGRASSQENNSITYSDAKIIIG